MKELWKNGRIITMDPKVSGNAILAENGRIIAVGDQGELADQAEAVRDLRGAALLPGFIDPHSHFSQVASGLMQADLEGADSLEAIGKRISGFAAAHRGGADAWILAKNYDPNLMPGNADPSIGELDALTPGPLVIQQKSGHMGLFNSAALARLGITADTPDPEGGKIGRARGRLTGYLEENAYFKYMKQIPLASMEDFLTAFRSAQELYASYGITTIQEGMLVGQMFPLYKLLTGSGIMKLDLVAYPDLASFPAARQEFAGYWDGYVSHVRMGGLKIFLDGSPQGRTAWMRAPYAGEKEYCGYGTLSDAEVLRATELAAKEKVQLLAHCNGDAAIAQYIRCVAAAEGKDPELARRRPVIIHAQLLGPDQIPAARDLGMIASFFVAHVYHWGDVHIRNFGMERAAGISPAHSALAAGLPFTFHQDAPVISPDMIETLWCAANRITKDGVRLGAAERITPEEALRAVTATAAYQYFEENDKGSLTPGKKADFVILDRSPLEGPAEKIRDIRVLETIKEGRTVYRREA